MNISTKRNQSIVYAIGILGICW